MKIKDEIYEELVAETSEPETAEGEIVVPSNQSQTSIHRCKRRRW